VNKGRVTDIERNIPLPAVSPALETTLVVCLLPNKDLPGLEKVAFVRTEPSSNHRQITQANTLKQSVGISRRTDIFIEQEMSPFASKAFTKG
jgi:hypothetical protein